jgi:hypothetical protein
MPVTAEDYTKELWRSTMAENVIRNWHHAGYKAVHLIVELSDKGPSVPTNSLLLSNGISTDLGGADQLRSEIKK